MQAMDMNKIGKQIAKLRKDKQFTQMGVADKLGVTYQAFSNWERGETMPDITKLPELADVLGVTIDELLLNQKETAAVKQLIEKKEGEPANIPLEEVRTLAPILTVNQVDLSVKSNENSLQSSDLIALAPHMSEAYLEKLVEEFYNKNGLRDLIKLFPFLSEEYLSKLAEREYTSNGIKSLKSLVPFLSEECIDDIARREFQKMAFVK